MKIWNTKYALRKGVIEQEAEKFGNSIVCITGSVSHLHGEGEEWHRTRESAVKKAEEMRKEQIVNVRKKLARLEAMRFE